jgi:hypothetical protein
LPAGYEEQTRFPEETRWEKPMGKYSISPEQNLARRAQGPGPGHRLLHLPHLEHGAGMFASLVTGNPTIVKPHPKAVLPIAIVVAEVQKVLAEHGLNPCICQLAVDADDRLITKELAEDPAVKLIDYTGGSQFGEYIEA